MGKNYSKAYKEVVEILKYVPQESIEKIPQKMRDTFTTKMDNTYNFSIDISLMNIAVIISPFILNIMETLIIKRFKPLYLNLIILLAIIIAYYFVIHFFGKMGMNIGDFASERLSEIKFIIQLCIFTIIGAFGGWWPYKFLTKPKIKKINLSSASSELSEE